jgi:YD repeat-containing protein
MPTRLASQIETLIVELKKKHPSWGAPKIREKLRRLHSEIQLPAISTVHAVLDRHGLVTPGRRSVRYHAEGTGLSTPTRPNDLWCADYKGEFMLADERYCYPLTITDFASRYLRMWRGTYDRAIQFFASATDHVHEDYDASGKLIAETNRGGIVHTITYDSSGRLSTVQHSFGQQLVFAYDSNDRLTPTTAPTSAGLFTTPMIVHEESHLREYQRAAPKLCAGTTKPYTIGYSSTGENQLSELNAFNVQLDYLVKQRKQPVCWSDDCEKEIEFMIGWILNTAIPGVIDGTYWSQGR